MSTHAKIISIDELKKLIESQSEKYSLIDVREREELEHGMIPTAFNVPLSELHEALNMEREDFKSMYGFEKPSKDERVIFHCRTGGRSAQAAAYAETLGFNSENYAGSIWEWAETDPDVKRYGEEPK